jgi:hypothetical protein
MPIQIESGNLLGTNNFHIVDVSSKLRGYTDGGSLSFNKYLRFYVLNYDSVTGEFDGYLGKRNPLNYNVTKTGQIVTGRPNVVTRFYDETNIDYIDVIFSDSSSSPGSLVMSTSTPRYVDLEIFPSLRTHDELFLLSSCEVNWDPISGENIVQYLSNKREFGSVDETDFTDSAKNYIASANKYLHENGVIRGLDLEGSLSGGELVFKGGSAIISGKVVVANNQSVIIPQIYPQSTSLPQTLDWAICLNEFGNLVPIILTSSKQIFFATDGTQNYQVISATFDEIINERKNLCLIAAANVTIASITINATYDLRKFASGTDGGSTLTLALNNKYLANFNSVSNLRDWVNSSNNRVTRVKLKGKYTITDSLDLSGFNNQIIIDGTDSHITVNTNGLGNGIILGSNVHLENCNFTYSPTGITYSSPPTPTVLNGGAGCIYSPAGDLSNVSIKNCSFESNGMSQHPPFINIEFEFGNSISEIEISNNKFDVINPVDDKANHQAAIAFVHLQATTPAITIAKNIFIKNNISKKYHGIYVTSADVLEPGFQLSAIIQENIVGTIGYHFGTDEISNPINSGTNYDLIIKNNIVKFICNWVNQSLTGNPSGEYSCGSTLIEGNSANWIHSGIKQNTNRTSLILKNNLITGWNFSSYMQYYFFALSSDKNVGIYTNSEVDVGDPVTNSILIEGNSIVAGFENGSDYNYKNAIRIAGPHHVVNNTFSGVDSGEYIMYCSKPAYNVTYYARVEGNEFKRNETSILGYVKIDDEYTSGKLFNNYFDFNTVNGSSKDLIVRFESGIASGTSDDLLNWICNSNKNQSFRVYIHASDTAMTIWNPPPTATSHDWVYWGATSPYSSYAKSSILSVANPSVIVVYEDSPSKIEFNWTCKLLSILQEPCTINTIYLDHEASSPAPTVSGTVQLAYYSLQGELTASGVWGPGDTIAVSPNEVLKSINSTTSTAQKYSGIKVRASVESATNSHQLSLKLYIDGQW